MSSAFELDDEQLSIQQAVILEIEAKLEVSFEDGVKLARANRKIFETLNSKTDMYAQTIVRIAMQYVSFWCRNSNQDLLIWDEETKELLEDPSFDHFWVDRGPSNDAEEAFESVLLAAEKDYFYFKVAKTFCAYCLATSRQLPVSMGHFCALVLNDEYKVPNTKKIDRMRDHGRNNHIFFDVICLVDRGMLATSGKENGLSACHAVAEGWGLGYENVVRIYKKIKKKSPEFKMKPFSTINLLFEGMS